MSQVRGPTFPLWYDSRPGPPDHRTPDHRTTGPPDTGPPDTGPLDHRTPDHRTPDHRTPTTGSAAPDTGQPDTGPPDHNYSCPLSRCWRHGFGKSMGVRQGLNQMAPKCQWMTFISHHPPDTCRRPWEIFEDDCQESNGRVPSVADTWEPRLLARAPCLGPPALGPRPWPADQAGTAGPTAPAVAA